MCVGFRKNFLDNPADFFLDKIIAVEQGVNVPRQYKASDGMCVYNAYTYTIYTLHTYAHMHRKVEGHAYLSICVYVGLNTT